MTKKQRALLLVHALKELYPNPAPGLLYDEKSAWQLLVSVRLAAQCTDVRVNSITPALFQKFPTPSALAQADVNDIEKIIHPCGLGRSKARDIQLCMAIIERQYAGTVPATMEKLLALPGVGRKSANLILGDIYGQPAIVVDTHCLRLCNRMGLILTNSPPVAEQQLKKIIPPTEGNDFCHRLVLHGRSVCTARSPRCSSCLLASLCKTGAIQNKAEPA